MTTGLIVSGRTQNDNFKINQVLFEMELYFEFNSNGNYFFLKEEEDNFDKLELMITNEFDDLKINYRIEGQF